MLGDTAIAVHPDDERYQALIGREAVVPGIGRRVPIIADTFVDPEFGSGAVKVTPGHDPNDAAMGERHDLPVINIMNGDGTLNENAGRWADQDRFDARAAYLEFLEAEGLLERTEAYTHSVGHCSRDGAVIEPLVSEQWFVNVRPLADASEAAVHEGRIRFHPSRFKTEFLRWLEGHPALVHFAAALAGPPDPGLVLPGLRRRDRRARGSDVLPSVRRAKPPAGS